jgi:predicted ATPase/DNA-binding SARP family transcriptional activator
MQFRLLGTLEITDDGEAIEVPAGKCRAALTLLLLRANRRVSADELIDALWGERAPAKAKNAVQVHVSQLRKLLGADRIDSDADGYRLRIDAGELDVERFEDLAGGGSAALARGDHNDAVILLNQALSWWRGSVLGGAASADFVAPAAARLEERREVAVEDRIDALLALGRHDSMTAELEALVAAQPLRERRRAQLILALYRSGQQAAALRAFEALRVMLRDELGLDPSREIAALETAMLQQSPALAWVPNPEDQRNPVETNLPRSVNVFVDREIEQVEVRGAVRRHRLVTLVGPGGVGKTRFAVELGWEMVQERAGAVWFVDLSGAAKPAELDAAIAAAFSLSDRADGTVLDALEERVGDARTLLILDGCERLGAKARPFVAAVVERCPGVTVLVTSRKRVGAPGELTWNMQPMSRDAAIELFVDRSTVADPRFTVGDDDRKTLEHICDQLDGIPLALELAAARTPYLSLEELGRRLVDRFALLRGGRGVEARHRTLSALIEWSYETLAAPERAVFRRFSVFEGGAGLAAAEAVCGDGAAISSAQVLDLLVELAGASLLSVQRVDGVPRYRMLDTIREFAQRELVAAEEAEPAGAAHRAFFLAAAEEANSRIDAGDEKEVVALFNRDRDNFIGAFRSAIAAEGDEAVRFGAAMWAWWSVVGFIREGVALIDAAAANHPAPSEPRRRALLGAGRLVEQLGDFDQATSRYEAVIELAIAADDTRIESHARGLLGHVCMQRGEIERASALHGESLRLAEASGDKALRVRALLHLGNMDWHADKLAAAADHYTQALAQARELGMHSATAVILCNLGGVLRNSDPVKAQVMLREALAIEHELGNQRSMGIIHISLSEHARDREDLDAAREHAEAALAAFRSVGDRWLEARAGVSLGTALHHLDDLDGAQAAFEVSLRVLVDVGDQGGQAQALHNLARVARSRGDVDAARRYYLESAEIGERVPLYFHAACSWGDLGDLEIDDGNLDLARTYLARSRERYVTAERPDRLEEVDASLERLRVAEATTS